MATRKIVIAGVFNRIAAPSFPWAYPGGAALYCALTGIHDRTEVRLVFKEGSSDMILLEKTQPVVSSDPLSTTEILAPLPPLPFPNPGNYSFEVTSQAGVLPSSIRLEVTKEM